MSTWAAAEMTVYKSLDACMKSINSRPFLLQRSKRRGLALMMVLCLLLCLVFNGAIRQSRIVDNLESIDSLKKFSMRQGVEKEDQIKQVWGGDPVYPTVNYEVDPNAVADYRNENLHEPIPDIIEVLCEER
ncbi:unnamed protein product [Calypogeia fissa]